MYGRKKEMIFLRGFYYCTLLMFLLQSSPAIGGCVSAFFGNVFGNNKKTEKSHLTANDRLLRWVDDVLGLPYSLSYASERFIEQRGLKAIGELPASEIALINFGNYNGWGYVYKGSFAGARTDSVLGLLSDKQLHQIPAEEFSLGYILNMQKTALRMRDDQFKELVDHSYYGHAPDLPYSYIKAHEGVFRASALFDLPLSFVKDNQHRLSPTQITWFPQIREANAKQFQDLNLNEGQILAYVGRYGLTQTMREAIPEGDLRGKAEEVNTDFLAKEKHFEDLLRTGSTTFKKLIERANNREAGDLSFDISSSEKASMIESMSLNEIQSLPGEIKKALVFKRKGTKPPLFLVTDVRKTSNLLPFMEANEIGTATVSFRREILDHLQPEDKARLSDQQAAPISKRNTY